VSLALKSITSSCPTRTPRTARIGGIMVLMLWFYCSGLALLLGAELNAEIEHASPYGKDRASACPARRRSSAARAQRLYEREAREGRAPDPADSRRGELRHRFGPAAVGSARGEPSDLIIGTIALAPARPLGRAARRLTKARIQRQRTVGGGCHEPGRSSHQSPRTPAGR
jgi:hypothetical protein